MLPSTSYPELNPALLTGNSEVDAEHRLLLRFLERLRNVCANFDKADDCEACSRACLRGCDTVLIETLGDLLMFLVDHFRTEEDLMRTERVNLVDREICELHKEDHAAISHAVQKIAADLDPMKTATHIRQLHKLLENWVTNHIRLHDVLLIQMIGMIASHPQGVPLHAMHYMGAHPVLSAPS